MIDYVKGIGGLKAEPIERWAVYFQCPLGLTSELKQAIEACESLGINPNIAILPVVVVETKTSYEVVVK